MLFLLHSRSKPMFGNITKFGVGALAIVLLGAGALYGIDVWKYKKSPEYRVEKNMEALEEAYANDPYGGTTPEETMALFIDALKKGDTNLAAKYFVLDKQEEWKVDLAQIKEKGLLDEMIGDLERKNKATNNISENQITFSIANEQNQGLLTILLGRGPNKKWKIIEL